MSVLKAPQVRYMARGETNTILTDWGENTSGEETGVLKAGDTVASCTVATESEPSDAADALTLGSVTVPDSTAVINSRSCSSGEWTQFSITTASDQEVGPYLLKLTATTTNGKVLPRFVLIVVAVP